MSQMSKKLTGILGCNLSIVPNGWRYGLVKADHYRPIEEQNIKQPLLTIPLVIGRLNCRI